MNVHFGARRVARLATATPVTDPQTGRDASPVNDSQTIDEAWASGGLVAHYAIRRSRLIAAEVADQTVQAIPVAHPIGRGAFGQRSPAASSASTEHPRSVMPAIRRTSRFAKSMGRAATLRQRLIAAGLAVTLCLAGFVGNAAAQQRYVVQPGDTLEAVAAEFGVDPEAIRRSSWLSNPPELTAGDVIIIPDPGQTPEEAATTAAELAGTSPWTSGVYWVEEGDSIESIAARLGVDPEAMLELNGLAWSDYLYPGQRLLIPGTGEMIAGPSAGETAAEPIFDAYVWVPNHQQERSLSCEYASAHIATAAFGNAVPEWAFIEAIPVTSNPHYGFRGDIDGRWGIYDDWGIYAEPMVPVLNAYGFAAEPFYSMGDPTELKNHLDAGHPVVVWLAMWGDTGQVYDDEGTYTVFAGSHVMTAYGYNDEGVFLSNPGNGTYTFLTWDTFLWMWGTIDGMSLAIYPY